VLIRRNRPHSCRLTAGRFIPTAQASTIGEKPAQRLFRSHNCRFEHLQDRQSLPTEADVGFRNLRVMRSAESRWASGSV